MAFPDTPLPVTVELLIDGAWTDITADTLPDGRSRVRGLPEMIEIYRGRPNEASTVEASRCNLIINNRDGKYSPRNPASPLYGKIGRNTPIRVSLQGPAPVYDSASGVVNLTDLTWTHTPVGVPRGILVFISHIGVSVSGRVTGVTYGGVPMTPVNLSPANLFATSPDMTLYCFFLGSNVPPGEQVVEVTTDGGTLARSGRSIAVTADSDVFVANVSVSESASVADPSIDVDVNSEVFAAAILMSGHDMHEDVAPASGFTQVLGETEVGGQVVNVVRRTAAAGPGTVTAGAWIQTAEDAAMLGVGLMTGTRFVGEVVAWPQRWDKSGNDVWVPIEAAGIMRRLGQGAKALQSAPRRAIPASDPVAYWPLDDGPTSTSAAPAVGTRRMTPQGTPPKFGTIEAASWLEKFPEIQTGNGRLFGKVSVPGFDDQWGVAGLMLPVDAANGRPQLTVQGDGSAQDGVLTLAIWASDEDELQVFSIFEDTSGSSFTVEGEWTADGLHDGNPHYVELRAVQDGDDIDFTVLMDGEELTASTGGTAADLTLQRPYAVWVSGLPGDSVGHVALWEDVSAMDDIADAVFGYQGETAGNRVRRLCDEEGVTFTFVGDLGDTEAMGPQGIGTFLNLLRECADADMGILYEPRGALGLAYRTRKTMYNQDPALELDYTDGVFAQVPEPSDDDQLLRNDITASRPDGSSARAALETGRLSTQAPPDGVGTYDESVTVNVVGDGFLANQAGWRLNLGTVDEARFPQLALHLHHPSFTGDATLTLAVMVLDLGDRVDIANLPEWVGPDLVSQLAQGFREVLSNFTHDIEINASPESPWQVGEYESAVGGDYRYDTAGSSLASQFVAGTDTSMSVDVDVPPLWTTDDNEFPLEIECGGCRLTVTDIAGASSPQTFTVSATVVNGVEKTIPAGTPVSLWTKARYAL